MSCLISQNSECTNIFPMCPIFRSSTQQQGRQGHVLPQKTSDSPAVCSTASRPATHTSQVYDFLMSMPTPCSLMGSQCGSLEYFIAEPRDDAEVLRSGRRMSSRYRSTVRGKTRAGASVRTLISRLANDDHRHKLVGRMDNTLTSPK